MIEILGVQIIGISFGLFMLYYMFPRFKRKEIKAAEFGYWLILWAIFTLFAIFPTVLGPISELIGFARRMDTLIVIGFIFLISLTFYNYITTWKNQKEIETIVRKIAIQNEK